MVIFSTLDIPSWLAVLPIFGLISGWLAKALLGVGSSLVKGIFGGKAKKQEREQKWKTYEKLRRSRRPSQPYSRGVDPVVQRAISNIFASRGMANPYAGAARTGGEGLTQRKSISGIKKGQESGRKKRRV